jgi:hypothetical protein
MRRALLTDLIKGGDARLHWAHEAGLHALNDIKTQRQLLATVEEYRAHERFLKADHLQHSPRHLANYSSEHALVPLDLQVSGPREVNDQSLHHSSTMARFVQQQRALRDDMVQVSVQLRQRRRQFRQVCSSSPLLQFCHPRIVKQMMQHALFSRFAEVLIAALTLPACNLSR